MYVQVIVSDCMLLYIQALEHRSMLCLLIGKGIYAYRVAASPQLQT